MHPLLAMKKLKIGTIRATKGKGGKLDSFVLAIALLMLYRENKVTDVL